MIDYCQYYTKNIYSKLLVDKIDVESPNIVLDMGVGDGSLTMAAFNRWSNAQYIALDIDEKNCETIRNFSSKIKIILDDGLSPRFNEKLKIKVGSVDVAICNPPYHKIKVEKSQEIIFKSAYLDSCISNHNVTSDIIFLANNLSLLRENGSLGIILPDGLLTRADFRSLRADLVNNHTLRYIIQLPDRIFNKTEARTHILILTKGKSQYSTVSLLKADFGGICIDRIEIQKCNLIERMDFNFQKWNLIHKREGITLSDINVQIARGSFSHKELKNLDNRYFHTTNFNNNKFISIEKQEYQWSNKIIAEEGDILMARVGKRCVGKLAYIETGNILISDCVYRIRVPKMYRRIVWDTLNSSYGKEWIKVYSHGVCAQVISKRDLLGFPLNINIKKMHI